MEKFFLLIKKFNSAHRQFREFNELNVFSFHKRRLFSKSVFRKSELIISMKISSVLKQLLNCKDLKKINLPATECCSANTEIIMIATFPSLQA